MTRISDSINAKCECLWQVNVKRNSKAIWIVSCHLVILFLLALPRKCPVGYNDGEKQRESISPFLRTLMLEMSSGLGNQ